MTFELKDKLAVVSGGARDIGAGVSIELARRGAAVAFCFHESEAQTKKTDNYFRKSVCKRFLQKLTL